VSGVRLEVTKFWRNVSSERRNMTPVQSALLRYILLFLALRSESMRRGDSNQDLGSSSHLCPAFCRDIVWQPCWSLVEVQKHREEYARTVQTNQNGKTWPTALAGGQVEALGRGDRFPANG
jgi:hypothetical protein